MSKFAEYLEETKERKVFLTDGKRISGLGLALSYFKDNKISEVENVKLENFLRNNDFRDVGSIFTRLKKLGFVTLKNKKFFLTEKGKNSFKEIDNPIISKQKLEKNQTNEIKKEIFSGLKKIEYKLNDYISVEDLKKLLNKVNGVLK